MLSAMDTKFLEPHQEPPSGEPYVLLNEAPDGLVTITAVKRNGAGDLVQVEGIPQPDWPDENDAGSETAEALARQLNAPLYLRRKR